MKLIPLTWAAEGESIDLTQVGEEFQGLPELSVSGIIGGAIRLILIAAALIFFFILVWGGIRWILSKGDKQEVENARNQITNALIGLAIVFVAWAIIKLIGHLFGVSILELNIPTFTGQ